MLIRRALAAAAGRSPSLLLWRIIVVFGALVIFPIILHPSPTLKRHDTQATTLFDERLGAMAEASMHALLDVLFETPIIRDISPWLYPTRNKQAAHALCPVCRPDEWNTDMHRFLCVLIIFTQSAD